jgi:hypothetical protein
MHLPEEARLLGTTDVGPLRDYIAERGPSVWEIRFEDAPAIAACDRIVLRYSRDYTYDLADVVDFPAMESFRSLVAPIVAQVCEILQKSNVSAVLIANLPAGDVIYPHVDTGKFLEVPSRVHIPLQTNPDVVYRIGGAYIEREGRDRMERHVMARDVRMAAGEIWEIDNLSYHSVRNGGSTDRWHLIINVW